MKTTPEFTDAEIQEMMDFGQVLALTEAARRRSKQIVRRVITTMLIAGLVGGTVFVYRQYSSSEPGATSSSNPPSSDIPPAIAPSPASVPVDSAVQEKVGPNHAKETTKKPAQETQIAKEKKDPIEEKKTETPPVVRADSTVSVFLPAEPVDGYAALYEYFARQLRYPEEAMKDSVQGVTSVTFIINKEGKPEHVTTDHALGEAFDQEAIRLIENMPAWKPAQIDGTPVRSKLSVPITFTLKTTRQQ